MTAFRCPGLPSTGLMTYLAGLGLARVISEQADPNVRFGWTGNTFVLRTEVTDLVGFLLDHYRPTPVVSPWNGGSGFGEKDKSQRGFVDTLASSQGERLVAFRKTIAAVDAVLSNPDQNPDSWPKARFVQELRNRVPDEALSWFDASVVLTLDTAAFPPLLGTGGNDGRLDYSSNFHQRLIDVLPELGAARKQSEGWVRDLLDGTATTRLQSAAIGQFDPLAAGGPSSSVFGAADSRVNPWGFVLMIEGITWFASSAARRLGESRPRATMPFTVWGSADGPTPGADKEESRGEFWAPVFESVTARQFGQVVREARATWQGRSADGAADMYGAVHSFGVDRGVNHFQRFGYLQRNGLAYVAVLLDTVKVENRPDVSIAAAPMRRAESFSRAPGKATERHTRAFESAAMAYLRSPAPERLVDLLAAQTRLEQVATRADTNRHELRVHERGARSDEVLKVLDSILRSEPEARVAAGLASATTQGTQNRAWSMRDCLLGSSPGALSPHGAVVAGFGRRELAAVLADLVVWRAQHPVDDDRVGRGFLPFLDHRYRTPWFDTHAWATGRLDEARLERYFLAFLAVDWTRPEWTRPRLPTPEVKSIDPDLAVLQGFATGEVLLPGVPIEAQGGRLGLSPSWPLRLRAGHVDAVCRDAATVLGRHRIRTFSGSIPTLSPFDRDVLGGKRTGTAVRSTGPAPRTDGIPLLAALCAPPSAGPLHALSAINRSTNSPSPLNLDEGVLS